MVYIHQQTAKIPLGRWMYTIFTDAQQSPSSLLRSYSEYYPLIVNTQSTEDGVDPIIQIGRSIEADNFKTCDEDKALKRIAIRRGDKRKYVGDDHYRYGNSSSSNRVKIKITKPKPIE